MQISDREEVLLEAFRRLPPDAAAELAALTERLAAVSPGKPIDWSDSWSDADLQEFTAASLARLDEESGRSSACCPERWKPRSDRRW